MSELDTIVCDLHAVTTRAAFVCEHLYFGRACGFHATELDDDPWPDAWCDLCEGEFVRLGGWTDENGPEIVGLCTQCYEEVRERNTKIPAAIQPGQLQVSEAEYAALSHAAFLWCEALQAAADSKWAFIGRKRWFSDPDAHTMRFYDEEDKPGIIADMVHVGSFSLTTGTWMWVWGNTNYSEEDQAAVQAVSVFGEVRGIVKLRDAHWEATEVDCWDVTQIAAYLLGADAVYSTLMDHLYVFMLLRNMRQEVWPH